MTGEPCPAGTDVTVTWVLGTLPPDEAGAFRRHLETCAACRADVARVQHIADSLAHSPSPAPAPPALRERIMAVVENEASLSRAVDEVDEVDVLPAPRAPPRRRSPVVLIGVAVVALLAGVAVAALSLRVGDRGDGSARPWAPVLGSVTEDGGGPRARAAIVGRGGAPELVLTNVAGPPRGRVYQAWVIRPPAAAIPTGALFSVTRSGDTRVRLPSLRGIERVIVTAEPLRGSRVPTPPPLVIVRLPR